MKSYCLKCIKNTENINPKLSKTSNGRTKLLSKCAIYNSHRSDAEKVNLIEEDEKIGINEVIKHNEIINNNLKYKYV